MNQKTKRKNKLTSLLLALCMVIAMLPSFTIDLTAFAAETATSNPSDDWEYTLNADGTATLTKYIGSAVDVYIPSTITNDAGERISVTALGEGVFKGNTGINSATFGEGITTIGTSAFEGATNLVCIVSPETLTTIGDRAFYGCTVFNSVILYDAVTSIGTDAFAECPTLTVWVNEGSAAHEYAVANFIPYEIINPNATPETYVQDGVTYYIMNGEAYAIAYDGSVTELVIPAMIEGYPVVELRETFKDNTAITSVVLSEGIKRIGTSVFWNCNKLVDVTLPESINEIGTSAFSGCTSLEKISLPYAITEIGTSAFANCRKLAEISLSNNIKTIDASAFEYCTSLTEVIIPYGVTKIGSGAFERCGKLKKIVIPDSVTEIGYYAFRSCSNLTDVTLSNSLTYIEQQTFMDCTALETIIVPDSVLTLNMSAFWRCSKLKHVTLSENLTSIPGRVFDSCTSLEEINIPNSVTYLGSEAFLGCSSLTKVYLPTNSGLRMYDNTFPTSVILMVYKDTVAHSLAIKHDYLYSLYDGTNDAEIYAVNDMKYLISNGEAVAFSCENKNITEAIIPAEINGYPVTKLHETFVGCTLLKKVTLPKTIEIIGNKAFYQTALEEINIPQSTTTLGNYAFGSCSSLKSVSGGDNLTSIGNGSFSQCKTLNAVSLSESLTELGAGTFSHCTSLSNIIIPNGVSKLDKNTFYNCTSLTEATIGRKVSYIDSSCFGNCSSLSDVVFLSPSVSISSGSFSAGSFAGCTSLKSIILPDNTKFDTSTFDTNIVLIVNENTQAHTLAEQYGYLYIFNDGINDVGFYTVDNITYCIVNEEAVAIGCADRTITEVIIPDKVEGYPVTELRRTFENFTALTTVTLPDSILRITENAFRGCTSLYEINLPDTVKVIGDYAFCGCKSLKEIYIPPNVTEIGNYAYSSMLLTGTLFIPDTVENINSYAFSSNSFQKVVIGNGTKTIGIYAFKGCRQLEEVVFGDSITSINGYSFQSCTALTSITFPDGLEKIDSYAFQDCSKLEDLEIPDNLTSIGYCAFYNCSKLTNVKLPKNSITIGNYAFDNTNISTAFIPESTVSMQSESFPTTSILCVYENSYAHNFAKDNNLLYFVLRETSNPEIAYGAGISGTVTLDGAPASGAEVSLLYDDGVVKETVTTDDTGAYTFTYAEVGAYTIRATSGSVSGTEKVSVKRMNAFDVFLSGETDIVLKGAYTVSGSVSPATATVTLTDTDGNVIEKLDVTTGTYSFANVPNGSYIVKAETENGSAVREVTVFNGDVTVENITIASQNAVIKGSTVLEKNGKHNPKIWIEVTLYDMDGNAVDSVKTESDGSYSFSGVPLGDYAIVARTVEMENHEEKGYLKPNNYAGFAYVEAEAAGTYEVETIYLREGRKNKSGLSGKVTAHGEHQACEVTLRDIFGNESAQSLTTEKNGKYEFCNVPDGIYVITAITESNGMGFTVVGVIDGIAFGETDIVVYKDEKVKERENTRHDRIPHCSGRDDAIKYRDKIAEEKRWYDGLSPKKKRHCSKEYIDWLMQLIEWITELECKAPNGATLSGGGNVLSGDELESDDAFTLTLEITDGSEVAIGEDGIQTDEQFVQQSIHDAAGDKTIAKYYNISLSKTDSTGKHNIKSIARDTDTTGKVRITMDIPEEYRGHKHYHFVHVHNGEPMTLVDLDDNPDTITFEVDRFSTFALTYTDEVLSVDGEIEEEKVEETNFGTLNAYIKDIKYQTDDSATRYSVILLSGIDSLNYREVGFEVKSMGITNETGTKVVYKKVNAYDSSGNLVEVIPTMFGAKMSHIFAQEYNFSDTFKNAALAFRPYAIKMNGEKIYGKETSIDIIFNERD